MDVAIVGIGCRFPGGVDSPVTYWRLLADGVDAVGEPPADRLDLDELYDPDPGATGKLYTRAGGYLEQVDGFDAGFFGLAPREVRRMDPQQRLLLEVVWEAFEHGGQVPASLAGSRSGVFVGISAHDYVDIQVLPEHRHRIDSHVNAGSALCIAANRISYLFDLRGPSFAVDTACSSSLTAVHLACRSLATGESELAVAAGVGILLAPEVTIGFCKASMLSPDGRCRAFDAAANGYVRSEGAGAVVLKPLERALADGDPITAVIRGSAVNQDGRTTGLSLPNAAAQEAMLREALDDAGLSRDDVGYVEAHGTGTPAGDPLEAQAIGAALGRPAGEGPPLLIGSVKTNLGHLEAAAGMAGLIKATLAVSRREIPANLHFDTPNPSIDFDGHGLRVPTDLEPWPLDSPAVAGVNSFGFGGANAHVVLAEAPPAPAPPAASDPTQQGPQLLPVSARNPAALATLAERYAASLDGPDAPALADVCYSAAVRRSHHHERAVVLADTAAEAGERLRALAAGEQHPDVITGTAPAGDQPPLAFVFTGMGPQWWGMGRQLRASEPVVAETLEEADALLRPLAGWSLLDALDADEGASRVADADRAHVANFALQLALARLWRGWGVVPDAVVGHSSGEMAAACVAGALSLPDALALAYHRGRLQHRTTGSGRMLAAGLTAAEAHALADEHDGEVSVAAVNAPASVTLSGASDVIGEIVERLSADGHFAKLLPVEVPYHGPQMDAIAAEFRDAVADLEPRPCALPMISTVTGEPVEDLRLDAAYWWRNIREPVRFADAVGRLADDGVGALVEVGPHPVLAGPLADCLDARDAEATVLPSLRRDTPDRVTLRRSLAGLHTAGRWVDWSAVAPAGRFVAPPAYPWQRERHWFDDGEDASGPDHRPVGVDTGHPLLGRRLPSAQPSWQADLADARVAYLDGHVVQGTALFPGTGYLEMACAAGRQLWGEQVPLALTDVEFRRLLFLPETRRTTAQLHYQPRDGRVEIHSSTGGDPTEWTLQATGRLAPAEAHDPGRIDVASLRERCGEPLSPDENYRFFEARGYTYDPSFQTLLEIGVGDGDALGWVTFPAGADLPVDGYQAHPALLDAALQLIGTVATRVSPEGLGTGDAPFFPVAVRRLELHRPVGSAFYAHVTARAGEAGEAEGDATVFDAAGGLAMRLEGIRLQVVEDGQEADLDDVLYELRWQEAPLPLPASRPPAGLPAPPEVAALLGPSRVDVHRDGDLAAYPEVVEPAMNRLADAYAYLALTELGWSAGDAPAGDGAALAASLGARAEHARLLPQLERMGQRARSGGAPIGADEVAAGLADLAAAAPAYAAEVALLGRGGEHLAAVLTGDLDPRELLFSGDAADLVARFYHHSPGCRPYHRVLADAIGAAVDQRSGEHPLRVLEVGAGVGAATAVLLPRLPGDVEYVFTDVSPLFLAGAEERFGEHPGLRCELFDLEGDPAAQGFDAGGFDIVVAANVLHVAADVRAAVATVGRLLAPGGLLAVVELTRRSDWLNLVFGLLDGWWAFTDTDLRTTGPMLTARTWPQVLTDGGLEQATALTGDGELGDVGEAAQAVLLARAPDAPSAVAPPAGSGRHWLLLADPGGVADRLAATLEARGDRCTRVHPAAPAPQDGAAAWLAPDDPQGFADLLAEIDAAGDHVDGVVHLWSLAAPGDDADAEAVMDAQRLIGDSVVALLRAHDLAAAAVPDLWLVTAGAQAVDGVDTGVAHAAQAPLWGIGRVLMSEYARVPCRLVDLPAHPTDVEIDALARELHGGALEEELALRGPTRLAHVLERAPRSARTRAQETATREPQASTFRLEIDAPGALERLALRDAPELDPGPGELAVRVAASGLNFRDVLQALDMLPAAAYQHDIATAGLGIECAGVVEACGPGVTRFAPGDPVITLTASAHASRVLALEWMTVAKPAHISFEAAASILNAFVTVEHALHRVARITAGERVLVHSAAGAVGLAAIQLCAGVGAEVLATAGTPEKRSHLRGLGVGLVADSRTLAFVDAVREHTDGQGVDVVLNSLAGEATRASLELLRPHGRFIELGKRDILADASLGLLPFQRNLSYHAVDLIGLALERHDEARGLLDEVAARVADGTYTPVPTTAFDLADAASAFRWMAQARHIGKVVLTVGEPAYAVRPREDGPLFRSDRSYLVTGGLGGFGLAVAEWMAAEGAGTVVLVSRSGQPREGREALDRLRAGPADVVVEAADVACETELAAVLDRVRATARPLGGVFHAAMVLDDDAMTELAPDRFAAVLAPKVAGAWNLHRLTAADELDHFVLFSSVAAVVGHPLQGNYAAANAFLDALASQRRAAGVPGLSIGWGAVADVGYVSRHPDLAAYLARGGFGAFPPERALELLEQLLRHDYTHVIAADMRWEQWAELNTLAAASRRFAGFVDASGQAELTAAGEGSPLALLRAASPADRADAALEYVRDRAASVLGGRADRVDADRPLTELGFDSLMAVELTSAFKSELGVRLPVVQVLQGASAATLARTIVEELDLGDGPESAGARPAAGASGEAGPASDEPPVPGESAAAGAPLSFEQERFWFLHQLDAANSAYHIPAGARLSGPLDHLALEAALTELVRRHPMLRTAIAAAAGQVTQQATSATPVHLPVQDLTDLPATQRDAELARRAAELAAAPFDLASGRLLRAALYRCDADEHVLALVVHHIACDAWAMNLLMTETAQLYAAYADGRASPLPDPPWPYVSYASAQRTALDDATAAEQLAYWRRQLDGAPARLTLPPPRQAPTADDRPDGHRAFALPAQLTAQVQALAASHQVTVFTLLLAAFSAVLHRLTGDEQLGVGTAVSTRAEPGADKVAGCFLNTVVLRADLADEPTFSELLARCRQVTLEAFANADVPFQRVVEAVGADRPHQHRPLFDALLILHSARPPQIDIPGLEVTEVPIEPARAVADLALVLTPGSRLSGGLQFDRRRVDDAFADAILGGLRRLLEQAVEDPERPVASCDLVGESQRRALLAAGSGPTLPADEADGVNGLLVAAAAATPEAPAVLTSDQATGFGQLSARVDRLAASLRDRGVGAGAVVAVHCERGVDQVIAVHATLRAGGAFLLLDPALPRERRRRILADAGPLITLASRTWSEDLPADLTGEVLWPDEVGTAGEPTAAAGVGDPEAPAYAVYTSGSTGEPKGVLVSRRALANQLRWRRDLLELGPSDTLCQMTAPSFDPAVWELLGPLAAGARLVIPPDEALADPAALATVLAKHQVTVVQGVPAVLAALAEQPALAGCPRLRHVLCGGEPLTPALATRLREQLPQVTLHHLYGLAETAIDATHWRCPPGEFGPVIPIGRPIANTTAHVLDRAGSLAPVGVAGELCIGGTAVASGYLGAEQHSAEHFLADPFDTRPGARLCRTGDLARRRDDGTLEFLGRRDRQVKVRGVRVEPGEVEARLREHPCVDDAAVIAAEGDATSERRLLAAVVADGEGPPDEELRAFVAEALPSAMAPASVTVLDALPRTVGGKVDRAALAERLVRAQTQSRGRVAPRNATERTLAEIWAGLLPGSEPGATDDFFALGGHSLHAAQVVAAARARLGVDLPVAAVLEDRTIERLAARVHRGPAAPNEAVALRGGNGPPLFLPPPATGSVFAYRALADALTGYTCYALPPPGLDSDGSPPTSVEEIAAGCLAALRRAQPAGAVRLAGWSMGGVVAYEMARQLDADGQRPAALVLLDAPAAVDARDEAALWRGALTHLGIDPADVEAALPSNNGEVDEAALRDLWEALRGHGALADAPDAVTAAPQVRVIAANVGALRRYRPGRYAGDLVIIDAARLGEQPSQPWEDLTDGRVRRHRVDVPHHDLLSPPHVDQVAALLADALADNEQDLA